MKIGLDLDDTLINTKEKIKIYWKDYYNKYPNKDYTEETPYNINFFGFDYIERFGVYIEKIRSTLALKKILLKLLTNYKKKDII